MQISVRLKKKINWLTPSSRCRIQKSILVSRMICYIYIWKIPCGSRIARKHNILYQLFICHQIDRLEVKLRKLQKVSLQKALSERKSDEARRLLDARLQRLDILSSATSTYSEV